MFHTKVFRVTAMAPLSSHATAYINVTNSLLTMIVNNDLNLNYINPYHMA